MRLFQTFFTYLLIVVFGLGVLAFFVRLFTSIFKK